ncbi:DUF1822 family protein [Microcoleus sp. Pol10D4]|uniref:DUF1822 family protein n=1 Tax=Microcoleus sp. Pol10D4 TaxID=3055387 RepID=UPI002FD690EE
MTYTSRPMFAVPLTSKALKLAKSFQKQYESPAKARQVYLNTLAVYAVDTYCQCLGIETDLEACDSLNPAMQPLMDVADLEIVGIGKLECRPVLPADENCYIPADTWENRIGYVAVEINESSREATLFGFYAPINPLEMMEQVSCESFQPLEAFLDHLYRLETALDFFQGHNPVAVKVRERLNEQSLPEIIAEMERIYRTYNKYERRYAGGEFLASYVPAKPGFAFRGSAPIVDREEFDDSQQTELQDLAEELLEKLDEIWGSDDSDESVNPGTPTNESTDATGQIPQPVMVPPSTTTAGLISLNEWLQKSESNSQYNWQSLESFLSNQEGNLIFRFASAPRSRTADTESPTLSASKVREISLAGYPVVLIVNCQKNAEKTDILIRLYPLSAAQTYLPVGIKLIVIDSESGDVFLEAQARSADNWIQLEFSGEVGEPFSIKVALEDAEITEHFAI